jgi:hypothetical protein
MRRNSEMRGSNCLAKATGEAGTCPQGHSFMHGISPFDASAGVAVWQTSSVPRTGLLSWPMTEEKEGGIMMENAKAVSTMTVCHLMKGTIEITDSIVNVKF